MEKPTPLERESYVDSSDFYVEYDDYDRDDESEKDFTACSIECGYCGKCDY